MKPTESEPPLFSVVICTYNRAELLRYSLDALAAAHACAAGWELLVIDNNSPDNTEAVTRDFLKEHSSSIKGHYFHESKQGLSHARNRGYAEANSDWVMYLDDDAKVRPDFLQRIVFLIQETPYKIIGGVYYPWYHFGQPAWFKDHYASNALPIDELSAPGGDVYACGGVMLWRKDLLIDLGGFDPNVGMIGNKIAYGEETFLQMKAKERNIAIAYDPELVIFHVVAKQKLDVDWFFKAYYARGRDYAKSKQLAPTITNVFAQLLIGFLVMLKDLLLKTPLLLFSKNYYKENWLIDVFRKPAKRIGTAYTLLKES